MIAAVPKILNVGSFRPLNHHVPAQQFGFGRPVKHEGAYHSFQESPSSMADSTSPESSGSESRRSSNEEKYASSTYWNGQNAFTSEGNEHRRGMLWINFASQLDNLFFRLPRFYLPTYFNNKCLFPRAIFALFFRLRFEIHLVHDSRPPEYCICIMYIFS